jgi:hypothetical protein
VVCNVVCEYRNTFNVIDWFEKHVKDCQITLKYKRNSADHKKEYKTILRTKKVLNIKVSQALNNQLTRLVRRFGNIRHREHNLQIKQPKM